MSVNYHILFCHRHVLKIIIAQAGMPFFQIIFLYNAMHPLSFLHTKSAMESRKRLCAVALPFLAYSHFNAFIHLSRMLATRGVTIIYVTLPSNVQFLRTKLQGFGDLPIYFQDLSVLESPLPPGRQNVNSISRDMLPTIFDLIDKMHEPLEALMAELSSREYYQVRGLPVPDRLVLIYDVFMGWSAPLAARFGIRSTTFLTSAHIWLCVEARFWDEDDPMPEVAEAHGLLPIPGFLQAQICQHMEFTWWLADGVLLNTFTELEPKFVRHLEHLGAGGGSRSGGVGGKPVWAIGPLIDLPGREKNRRPRDTEIVQWLDRQRPGSVVYVSFGSESYISPAQVTELALGLEASGHPFLWVLRPPISTLGNDSPCSAEVWKEEVLPEGYERRLGGRCLIETGWAPQAAVLQNEATGAFITHCGWNSILESVVAGVPMIVFPLHSDQPANAVLVVKEAKVAMEMQISDGIARRDEVESSVKGLFSSGEMRRKAKAVSRAAAAALSEEGPAWKNLDAFIQYFS